ncbi:DUF2235 domain-containing protein [Cyanobium sp. NIES-981]|uniref:DUF2235 domain-containing protein n=1 Tax=Cyanobium sp. NIES-981 TaxID=1851505 RepID=UPI0007DD8B12|nr:DUF2235 domain-containing protein [Cyanobium sp. NIES-981]SBO43394.1 conserved protein of unknown function [Cyanobium sp. NIES-981]
MTGKVTGKNLIVLSDGTWQDLAQPFPTNVVRLLEAIPPQTSEGRDQLTYYDEGVGTKQISIRLNFIDNLIKIFGGAFGIGIDHRIMKCYRFLCLNYSPGDQIYLFGFSRGAYTVRSLAGLIYNCGLLRREQVRMIPRAYEIYRQPKSNENCAPWGSEAVAFRQKYAITDTPDGRPPIRFLGVWDTVKALGLPELPLPKQLNAIQPSTLFNAKYKFHDEKISPIIHAAYHAVSIEEERSTFSLIPIDTEHSSHRDHLQQAWFPGGHGGVGGGDQAVAPLSDGALQWMLNKLETSHSGLHCDIRGIQMPFQPNPSHAVSKGPFRIIGFITVLLGKRRRIIPLHTDPSPGSQAKEVISEFAHERLQDVRGWLPKTLHEFFRRKQLGEEWTQLVTRLQDVSKSLRPRG